jgi:anaerobic ribonucleoside-triphosphate reductase
MKLYESPVQDIKDAKKKMEDTVLAAIKEFESKYKWLQVSLIAGHGANVELSNKLFCTATVKVVDI